MKGSIKFPYIYISLYRQIQGIYLVLANNDVSFLHFRHSLKNLEVGVFPLQPSSVFFL